MFTREFTPYAEVDPAVVARAFDIEWRDRIEPGAAYDPALERAVDYILDDCFFTVGQTVQNRKALDHDALVWWRDHYRVKFLRAMTAFGNRWAEDRSRVKAVGCILANRAVHYAGDRPSIDRRCAEQASADVERYCSVHAARRRRQAGMPIDADHPVMHAGYWCPM